jgi:hypothetical protein
MESIKTSTTAPAAPQVRSSFLDRLLFSSWYLEARTVVERFTAHHAAIVRRLDELVSLQREPDGGAE